ncbi:putative S-adenosyl-L-methionine-dependent methyltransferase [Dillenia turbinata]|uniref:Methyltransferase n=1 Tax=Dillenia turbinata TaxID=194707 RepID=A0AAN8UY72_9MAGN
MAWYSNPPNSLHFKIKLLISQLKKFNLYYITTVVILCSLSYLFGIWQHPAKLFTPSNAITGPCTIPSINATSSPITTLDFTPHHSAEAEVSISAQSTFTQKNKYPVCDLKYSEYTPCEDTQRSLKFPRERLIYRERHCPDETEGKLKCRVPAPYGYKTPFPWPQSRDYAWYANVPHKWLTVEKGGQNWVRFKGERFSFPGGGTMFPRGANAYIDEIGKLINLKDGSVRTAIDTGCGVASWGGYLLSRNILPLSFAPKDTHEAQVQFALERGIPALIGILASNRLPYPSRAFDMAHCSRCLIPWGQYDGLYLIEVDRILRPGGYWILSGPPINWEAHWKGWQRAREDLKAEQDKIESIARSLCWKKLTQRNDLAIWQKPSNHIHCKINRKVFKFPQFCSAQDPDQAWYTKMDTCLTPLPEASEIREVAGGQLAKWPERLHAIPPRISSGSLNGITAETFRADSELWKKRVWYYKSLNNLLAQPGRYRNLLDMNAYLGGFAAALISDPVWVMNVVPVEAKFNTLGVVYERGLIGTYQNWCEAMSTYPRTYDFIHANSVFTLYDGRCEMEDILLEMDRILRPEGCVIFRDDIDVLVKIKDIIDEFDWDSRIVDHEDGPFQREKLLVAVKLYWTAPAPDSNQNQSSSN